MINKDYYISEEQFEDILHYKNMFEVAAENLEELCKQETAEIKLGFELGRANTHLRDWYTQMLKLSNDIAKQKLTND